MMSDMKNKICLLVPYYGVWPAYLPFFLRSIAHSHELIDVVFITDLSEPDSLPSNVRLVRRSLSALCASASAKLGISVEITRPYKLCDLRPAFGLIFDDLIANYSHWAFGDIDVIYGDVPGLLPRDWQRHDVLIFREEWVTGSLAVFRNHPFVNHLFRRSGAWARYVTEEPFFGFDECLLHWGALSGRGPDGIFTVDAAGSLTHLVRVAELAGELRVWRKRLIKESIAPGDWLLCADGRVTDRSGAAYLYYHLITEKKTHEFALPADNHQPPRKYYIDRYGLHEPHHFQTFRYHVQSVWRQWRARALRLGDRLYRAPGRLRDLLERSGG